jgi:hypothetical protein
MPMVKKQQPPIYFDKRGNLNIRNYGSAFNFLANPNKLDRFGVSNREARQLFGALQNAVSRDLSAQQALAGSTMSGQPNANMAQKIARLNALLGLKFGQGANTLSGGDIRQPGPTDGAGGGAPYGPAPGTWWAGMPDNIESTWPSIWRHRPGGPGGASFLSPLPPDFRHHRRGDGKPQGPNPGFMGPDIGRSFFAGQVTNGLGVGTTPQDFVNTLQGGSPAFAPQSAPGVPNAQAMGFQNRSQAAAQAAAGGRGQFGLPLDPTFEAQRRLLEDSLQAQLAQIMARRQQLQPEADVQLARLATEQARQSDLLDESLVGRGIYRSGIRGQEQGRLGNLFDRSRQDISFSLAQALQALADQEAQARLGYNQGLMEMLLQLANRSAANPFSPLPAFAGGQARGGQAGRQKGGGRRHGGRGRGGRGRS